MSNRSPISKSLRFRVLERDNFTCRYCGAQPPDVVLHLDHVVAVANGGQNTFDNLVTACLPCNIGKGVMSAIVPATSKTKGVGKRKRPRVEFFWNIDHEHADRHIVAARCIEWPDRPEEEAPWLWEEVNRYWFARPYAHYCTHGASTEGFCPHEAAMYAAEILHHKWATFRSYISFIDDLLINAEAGHLPAYIAPFTLRALHIEVAHARCGKITSEQEYTLDRMADQGVAVFSKFLASEFMPWRSDSGDLLRCAA